MSESFGGATTAPGSAERGRGPLARFLVFLRDVVLIVVIALVVSFLVTNFLIRTFYIPSSSMENTLQEDDRILVNQLTPRFFELNRGDVVVFQDPGGWLGSTSLPEPTGFAAAADWFLTIFGLGTGDSNSHLVKRIVGLPGDTVVCCDDQGRITVNGVGVDEPYVKLDEPSLPASGIDFNVTVPEGSLWVLGDNRYSSADSRLNTDKPGGGFVPIDNVVGRAEVISLPVERWSAVNRYPDAFAGVPDPAAP